MRTCSPGLRPPRGASRSSSGCLSERPHKRGSSTGAANGHSLGAVGLLVAMVLVCRPAAGQDPIAIGETRPGLDLRGQVLLDGGGMPGVAVSIRRAGGSEIRTTVTDQDGRFRLRDLAPGTYSVTAAAAGFAAMSRQVSIIPGSTANVVLAFGGPVPVPEPISPTPVAAPMSPVPVPEPISTGEPNTATPAPTPASAAVVVLEKDATSDLTLQQWLAEQATGGLRLELVTPHRDGTSLFVFRPSDGAPRAPIVFLVSGAPSASGLEARLRANPARRCLGIHLVSDQTYLLVVSDDDR